MIFNLNRVIINKLIVLIAIIVLKPIFVLAGPPGQYSSPPTPVLNRAIVDIQCSDMVFTCAGPVYTQELSAGDPTSIASGVTTWYITNWGTTGKFMIATPTIGLFTVTPPLGGRPTDLTVTAQSGFDDGWSRSNVIPDCYAPHWKLATDACNSVGTLSYNFKVTASSGAVSGIYVITFSQDFTVE